MSRTSFRMLGILFGLFAGTVGALVSINFRRARQDANSEMSAVLAPSQDTELGETSESAPPDPGNRRQLAELRAASAKDPEWKRSFELTERSGLTVRSEDLKGEPYIACFFFSTCPGTCKRQSGEMRLLQSKFKGRPIRLVSISVDPEIDTPEVLAEYAESFGADKDRWLFLTGPLDDIIRVGTEMFFLPGVERRGHPDRFCLVDAEGNVVGSYVWLVPEERELLIAHAEELIENPTPSETEAETPASK
jgi:protein SCO1